MLSKPLRLVVCVFLVHLTAIYLFTSGFLLSRLSLPDISSCPSNSCTLHHTHSRAVLLIIDSLRFDFISPTPLDVVSPFHHNVLNIPRELTAKQPRNSFIFNSYADPPTTTLQRIKGITTGSLPTFVDIGNNFGASSIEEDSIMAQLTKAGKRAAFMGDDTWMSVFPDSFHPNMTFPYDSFNVEDLHSVDEGVIAHLFPLLEDKSKPFDFLVGHFLGVDHVGHRVGPDHPSMKAKLQQMDDVLRRVVKLLDDDTLLVVLGDHGMDRAGDHGGDGVLETSAALWVYSKGHEFSHDYIPSGILQYKTFPSASVPHRSIQQIDILPTLSLLLGLPIPYNNLGTVIPELFWRDREGKSLEHALSLNAAQIKGYLDTYRVSPSGGELSDGWWDIESSWSAIQSSSVAGASYEASLVTLVNFNRTALSVCRAMWAQFNPILMSFGLILLSMGVCSSWAAYQGFGNAGKDRNVWLSRHLALCARGAAGGAVFGLLVHVGLAEYLSGISALDCVLFAALLTSCVTFVVYSPPIISMKYLKATPFILVLHTIAFLSNSFTFWEDRIVPFLLITSIVPSVLTGFTAATSRLRYRILGFSALFAVCVRLMAISTVCREEQQPYCHVTFYSSTSLAPFPVLVLAIPTAIGLPWIIKRFLHISRSDMGLAVWFLPFVVAPSLLGGSLYWIIEWAEAANQYGEEWAPVLRLARTYVARSAFGWSLSAGVIFWWLVPLCIDIKVNGGDEGKKKRQVTVIGFANAFGSPYLMFWCISFVVVFIATQLTGQIVLALCAIGLISYLEVLDSFRDVHALEAVFASSTPSTLINPDTSSIGTSPLTFSDIIPIALLGLHAFYGTGHQATISSIQWKTAFMVTPTVVYPFSPMSVVINSIGAVFLLGVAAPLVGIWNKAPAPAEEDSSEEIKSEATLACLGVMIYYSAILLGTAVSAAILRRHLMVWKVFAPRFMTGVVHVVVVDIGVLIGIGIGIERIGRRVGKIFDKLIK